MRMPDLSPNTSNQSHGSKHSITCDEVISKVKKILNLWDLTIYGKTQVVKSLALSKLWYIAAVTVPPPNTVEDISKLVWEFIWSKKRQPVNRKTCCAPIDFGGIGMIDIDAKCKCLKIKWLLRLMKGEEGENDATKLGRFYLNNFDKSFSSFQVITTHLKNIRNDNAPPLYLDIIESWKFFELKRIKLDFLEPLLEEYIWLNPEIKQNGKTFYNPTWIQAKVLKLKDIWDDNTDSWLEVNTLIRKFPPFFQNNPRAIIDEFRKIKSGVEQGLFGETLMNKKRSNTITESNFLALWYGKKFVNLSSRTVYQLYMKKKFGPYDEICENDKNWWTKLKSSDLDRKIKQLLWKTFHSVLPLGEKLKIWFNENGLCTFCSDAEETHLHLFRNCPMTKDFLTWVCNGLLIPIGSLTEEDMKSNFHNSLDKGKFYVLAICRKVIWDLRNSIKYKGLTVDLQSFKINFRVLLKSHLQTLMWVYLKKDDLTKFTDTYSLNNFIKVENQKVLLNI